MTCNRCTQSTKTSIWSDPFQMLVCRACKDEGDRICRVGGTAIVPDDIPGGLVCENYGPEPITFYSHTERRRYMAAHGLREKETFCPLPGTDKDPAGIPNPEGYVDDYTMRSRQELFLRAHNRGAEKPFDAMEAGVVRNQFEGRMTDRDAVAVTTGDVRRQSRLGRRLHG